MILKMLSVFDSKAEAFAQPFFSQSTGAAVRSFGDECNNPESNLCKHSSDFTLFELGTFDDQTGLVSLYEAKKSLGLALDYKKPSDHERAEIFNPRQARN